MESRWRIDTVGGVPVARCAPLTGAEGIVHGFSLRYADGEARFDLGTSADVSPETLARRGRFLAAVGLGSAATAAVMHQVHGADVVAAVRGGPPPEADGAIWERERDDGSVPAVRTADCVAVILADRRGRAAACLHAGWKGTAAGIVLRGVEALARRGVPPDELIAALGPAILRCCYEVGDAVATAVEGAAGGEVSSPAGPGKRFLDLHRANRLQLVAAGVREDAIHAAPWCTRCRGDLFFSFRGEGEAAGRTMAVAGPSRRP